MQNKLRRNNENDFQDVETNIRYKRSLKRIDMSGKYWNEHSATSYRSLSVIDTDATGTVEEKWKSAIEYRLERCEETENATQIQEDALSGKMEGISWQGIRDNLLEIDSQKNPSHRSRSKERERERAQAYRSSSRSILIPRLIVPVCRYLLSSSKAWLVCQENDLQSLRLFLSISLLLFLSEDNSCLTTMNKKKKLALVQGNIKSVG